MDQTEIEREARRRRQLQRLGTDNPSCAICGEDDVRVLERHHIAGRAYAEETAIVCRNCHRKLSDDQRDHPAQLGDEPEQMERIGHWLLGLGELLAYVAKKLVEAGRWLIEEAKARIGQSEEPS